MSEQSCHIMFLAPSSVLEHGAGARGGKAGGAGREGGACGRGGAGGGSGGKELLSRQPEAQQYTWQHSSSSHTLSEHRCGSSKLAAVLEAGHWRLPLSSPWSRQPEAQHCAKQQSLAKHAPPLQMCPSSRPRAICPAGHSTVPFTAAALESRKPASQHVLLLGAPQHSASLHPPVRHSYPPITLEH